jgi:hypothetical protein
MRITFFEIYYSGISKNKYHRHSFKQFNFMESIGYQFPRISKLPDIYTASPN